MGLILAAAGAIGGNLGDQWLDAIEAQDMGEGVVFCKGARLRSDDRRLNQIGRASCRERV